MKKRSRICGARVRRVEAAFTLLEVMIAVAIFFIALFSILELMSGNLRAARKLKQPGPTIGMAAAQLSQTNHFVEDTTVSGDFGELFPDYKWDGGITLASSNGLYQVDFTIYKGREIDSTMSALFYRPQNAAGGPGTQIGAGPGGGAIGGGNGRNAPGPRIPNPRGGGRP